MFFVINYLIFILIGILYKPTLFACYVMSITIMDCNIPISENIILNENNFGIKC